MWGSVGGSVLGPHTLIHFLTPPPFFPPHPYILSPHANTLPHSPHTLSHTPLTSSHSFPHLPLHPNTLPTHPMHSSSPLPTVSIMRRSCYQGSQSSGFQAFCTSNRHLSILFPKCFFSERTYPPSRAICRNFLR